MIRLLKPEKIIHQEEAGRQLQAMIEGLEPFIVNLYDSNSPEQEGCGAALARSIELLLNTENPYLDIPIPPYYKNTIRELIVDRVVRHIPADIRAFGAYARFEDRSRLKVDTKTPLLIPQDQRRFSPTNFNSAMLGTTREWLMNTAQAWIDAENRGGDAGKTFEKMLKLAAETLSKYYKAKDYEAHFYSSATVAAIDVFPKLALPESQADDYVMGSNQEYSAMMDESIKILERDAPDPEERRRAEFFELNTSDGTAKTAEQILSDIKHIVSLRGKAPRMLILSSKTRYGDSISIHSETKRSHFYALSQLIKAVKSEYPLTTVAIDGCQSVGRNDLGEDLDAMGPDLFFNSAGKALGVPNCGILMIRKDFNGFGAIERLDDRQSDFFTDLQAPHFAPLKKADEVNRKADLKGTRSTIDLPSVVATNLALRNRMGKVNSWAHPVLVEDKNFVRDVEIETLITLTEYAIGKAGTFGSQLTKKLKDMHSSAFDNKLEFEFGTALTPSIAYPTHGKRRDYNGILSIGFPGIKGSRLSALLSEYLETNTVTTCLKNGDAIRISFLPSHTQEDVDVLFDAIQRAVMDEFSRQIKKINMESSEKTKTDLELWLAKRKHSIPVWEN